MTIIINCGEQLARVRLLWDILSLVLPVTLGHTTACRSQALTFSAAIHFAIKRSSSCSAVLCHFPSSSANVVHWSALIPKALGSSRRQTHHPLFFLAPCAARAPHQFSEHHALRQSRVLPARHKYRKQDPPPAHNRLDALTSHVYEGVQIGNWVFGAIPFRQLMQRGKKLWWVRLGAACHFGTRAGSMGRSRTALSRVPRLLASGF